MSWEKRNKIEQMMLDGLGDDNYRPGPVPSGDGSIWDVLGTIFIVIIVICLGCPAIPIVLFILLFG